MSMKKAEIGRTSAQAVEMDDEVVEAATSLLATTS